MDLYNKNDIVRCEQFVAEIASLHPSVNAKIVCHLCERDWVSYLKGILSGTEAEVRARQVSCPGLNLEGLWNEFAGYQNIYDELVYLNWGKLDNLVQVPLRDLLIDVDIMECLWYPIQDDVDIIFPNNFVYSIDHHEQVWKFDWGHAPAGI